MRSLSPCWIAPSWAWLPWKPSKSQVPCAVQRRKSAARNVGSSAIVQTRVQVRLLMMTPPSA
eukprot:7532076-Lingulodinium_polyedra.AAC.1